MSESLESVSEREGLSIDCTYLRHVKVVDDLDFEVWALVDHDGSLAFLGNLCGAA